MKLVEGLKQFKIIDSRIEKNIKDIQQFSSAIEHASIQLPFGTLEAQKKHVKSLLQANVDLVKEKLSLKTRIAKTNLETTLTIDGITHNLLEWQHFRTMAKQIELSFAHQSLTFAQAVARQYQANPEEPLRIVRAYDEKERMTSLQHISGIMSQIDGKLEVVNATTDLME